MSQTNAQQEFTELALQEGLPVEEVEKRIGLAYAAAGLKHRVVAFYLQDVEARGLHQLAGCRTVAQYAACRFGMSRREARDLLAAGKALQDLVVIDDAFAEGKLCWSKVRELVKVATPQHEERWLVKAIDLSIDELALEVRLARPGEPPRDRDDRKGLPEIRMRLNTALPPDVFAKWEQAKKKIQDESGGPLAEWECLEAMCDMTLSMRDDGSVPDKKRVEDSPYCVVVNDHGDSVATVETEDGPVPVDALTAELIACDCCHVDPADLDREADRRVPLPLRRKVLAKGKHRCAACGGRHRLQMHHVVWYSEGGPTVFANLVPLCRRCHSLVHAGLLRIEGSWKKGWRFFDRQGRDIHGAGVPPGELLAGLSGEGRRLIARAEAGSRNNGEQKVRLRDLPGGVDAAWWRRHAHLVSYSDKVGAFNYQPGLPMEDHTGGGTMCQPHHDRGLDDLIGQEDVVEPLKLAVRIAAQQDEPLDHTLLTGPPGLGKTTIARALAADMGVRLHATSGLLLKSPLGLLRLLAGLGKRDVVFIDEIHALPSGVAEFLYEALSDCRLSLLVTCGAEARTLTLCLEPFTLIGATTDEGVLPEAFLSRFENREHLSFYTPSELTEIVRRGAGDLGLQIDDQAAGKLARVSRETPRDGLRLLRRVRREAIAAGRSRIDVELVAATLERLGIDERGLGRVDRALLEALLSRGPGQPIGIGRLAATIGVPARTLERRYEPYLFRLGLITTTPHGRVALPQARHELAA